MYKPVVQTSQIGYHVNQPKEVVIERDIRDNRNLPVELLRIDANETRIVKTLVTEEWGKFLRYNYLKADFSDVTEEGLYQVKYGESL